MFKKYGIGLLSVLIACMAFAFTKPAKPTPDTYVFEFDGSHPGGYSVANVSNISNTYWKFVAKNAPLCSSDDQEACRVSVGASYVNSTVTPTALKSVTINAMVYGTIAYVSSISGAGNVKSNKLQ